MRNFNMQLLEIIPRELKFIFEVKKQCSCSVQLVNNTPQFVAFKVKTTSPKKYCVRPNVGIVMPNSTCEFSVTMQAQRSAPPDMICKDKFLIQSTAVPSGTTDEDITSSMFFKVDGKYVEETKLRVTLVHPSPSSVISPVNGGSPHSPVLSNINGLSKQEPYCETTVQKFNVSGVEKPISHQMVMDRAEVAKNVEGPKWVNGNDLGMIKDEDLMPSKIAELKSITGSEINGMWNEVLRKTHIAESQPIKNSALNTAENVELRATDVEELKVKPDLSASLNVRLQGTNSRDFSSKNSELRSTKDERKPTNNATLKPAQNEKLQPTVNTDLKPVLDVEFKAMKNVEELKVVKEIEELKSKLSELASKLSQAEFTISRLTEDRGITMQERERIKAELANLRNKGGLRKVQVGFPPLFVCMVALISVVLGYISHP